MYKSLLSWGLSVLCGFSLAHAKEPIPPDPEFDEILAGDLSELSVTSVSKRSQRLSDTAAAVYVITQEELRRAGIYSIPEALRMVPGINVAKVAADRWAVSARGFNNANSNKLLVLIDGRAIYTPVFSGVYWGDQSTTINDIERIEVIRGPGASLYGANAVNGVVNIITKSAENTQGNMVSTTINSRGTGLYEARHGGKLKENAFYRVFGQYADFSNWDRERGGFRIDGRQDDGDSYTFQGDAYQGSQDAKLRVPSFAAPYTETFATEDNVYGGNLLGRWNTRLDKESDVSIQAYVDHYTRKELNFEQNVSTADIQAQHSIQINDRNNFIWGGGGRLYYQNLQGTFWADVEEQYDTHEIINAFVQNEYALVPETVFLTLGSKFEYNDFTGFEAQPTARALWHVTDNHTVWGAVSRAVRTPSSIEEDVSILGQAVPASTELRVVGNPSQDSEELIAYELGHRMQVMPNLFLDSTVFFNDYDQLQTIGLPGTPFIGANGNTIVPYAFNNLGSGHTYGAEFAATWNADTDWRIGASYSYLEMNLDVEPGTAVTLDAAERQSPRHQFSLQSYYNITDEVHWDNMIYYVSALSPPIDSYVRYDTRVAWMAMPGLELSLIGRNLVDPHPEFQSSAKAEVDRSYIGQVLWKF